MGSISENFDYHEFEESETAKKHKIMNIINTFEVRDAVKELVVTVLQPLRTMINREGHVNSGYRCKALNDLIPNSSTTSQHIKGEAADMDFKGVKPIDVARMAVKLDLPFDQIIVYPTFCHISHKKGGPQRKKVLYNKSYTGPRL